MPRATNRKPTHPPIDPPTDPPPAAPADVEPAPFVAESVRLRCVLCDYVWSLPMSDADLAAILADARCPSCKGGKGIVNRGTDTDRL